LHYTPEPFHSPSILLADGRALLTCSPFSNNDLDRIVPTEVPVSARDKANQMA
jgi:hypothetical protein